jgi:hypothetical protein
MITRPKWIHKAQKLIVSDKMNNSSILSEQKAFKDSQHATHRSKLRQEFAFLKDCSDEELDKLYWMAVSCFQSKSGKFLEAHIEKLLKEANVPFKAQLHITSEGIIVESGGCTIIDIVFGKPVIGDHIGKYAALSLKTTSRERAKLDTAWTVKHPPKLFLYGTLEDDYPQPKIFEEGPTRKLICAKPKKKDLRQFKLGFENIIEEVQKVL